MGSSAHRYSCPLTILCCCVCLVGLGFYHEFHPHVGGEIWSRPGFWNSQCQIEARYRRESADFVLLMSWALIQLAYTSRARSIWDMNRLTARTRISRPGPVPSRRGTGMGWDGIRCLWNGSSRPGSGMEPEPGWDEIFVGWDGMGWKSSCLCKKSNENW